MALPNPHPTLKEQTVGCHTASSGATPIAAVTLAPFRGQIVKVKAILAGTLTGDATVTVAINGTTVTGGTLTLTASGSVVGTLFTATPTAANNVNEDDAISFTPASGTGTTIPCTFLAVIRAG